ncbi:MAG: 2-amino-4-hydroxy-6-hydroxymethyldihydropteridine diphosphokinase [Bacteroidales bacterium]|jgi:2-amino-4-hydroxy-6-hydroxymethyldihydropteridine diphosphokinase
MPKKNQVFLLLGSNINPRLDFIRESIERIEKQIGIILKNSHLYETEPWGFESDTLFLNQVIEVQTIRSVIDVHSQTRQIELEMGRLKVPGTRYTSRNIDIDILYFNQEVLHSNELTIPHPRLHVRRFTLIPLVEIVPEFRHPVFKLSQRELLEKCTDQGIVRSYQTEQS